MIYIDIDIYVKPPSLFFIVSLQQFGKILDVEIIFNERGSKVLSMFSPQLSAVALLSDEFLEFWYSEMDSEILLGLMSAVLSPARDQQCLFISLYYMQIVL